MSGDEQIKSTDRLTAIGKLRPGIADMLGSLAVKI